MNAYIAELGAEQDVLFRYAAALTHDRTDAEDLLQNCMERALRKWNLRRDSVPLRPWLLRMMRNFHVSHWRKVRRHMGHFSMHDMPNPPMVDGGREDYVDLNALLARVMALSDDQREVLILLAVQGLSYCEVAQVLDVAEGTIMSRISRARARLRGELTGPAISHSDASNTRPTLRCVK